MHKKAPLSVEKRDALQATPDAAFYYAVVSISGLKAGIS